LFINDMAAADRLHGEPFWVPMNLDWRGRLYGVPFFNYERQDWVRSLFRFARGKPIGVDGLHWLKIHLATTGDFDRISKRPFAERIEWVNSNISEIQDAAARPIETFSWWSNAGIKKRYQFLSACIELSEALRAGPNFVSRLPVSFDATASGLQHLCAMSRAEEGALVNLTRSEVPQDVYGVIADAVAERIRSQNLYAAGELLILGLEITRSLVKNTIMTYFYNSGEWNQTEQLTKSLTKMGFHKYAERSKSLTALGFHEAASKALSYRFKRRLITLIRHNIEQKLPKPKEVMEFVGNLALVLAAANKPLSWISPCGMPISNRYKVPETRRVEFRVSGKKHQYTIATGFKSELDTDAMVRSAAPNFVHSCDAAHMALVTNAAVSEGIVDLAMVHDSFGCPAAQAGRFREIIREQFVKMYEQHDILAELRASAALDLGTDEDLPPVPDRGNLDLHGVLKSDFAFD
jgi:DNA-directed RNA polymerase